MAILGLTTLSLQTIGKPQIERTIDNEAQALHQFCQSQGHDYYYETGGYVDRDNAKSTMSITCVDKDGTNHFYDFGPVDTGGMTITSSKVG